MAALQASCQGVEPTSCPAWLPEHELSCDRKLPQPATVPGTPIRSIIDRVVKQVRPWQPKGGQGSAGPAAGLGRPAALLPHRPRGHHVLCRHAAALHCSRGHRPAGLTPPRFIPAPASVLHRPWGIGVGSRYTAQTSLPALDFCLSHHQQQLLKDSCSPGSPPNTSPARGVTHARASRSLVAHPLIPIALGLSPLQAC